MDSHRLACQACTKRKVKCDRLPVCSSCKRRGELCEYPKGYSRPASGPHKNEKRLKDLENYIRVLGGDPSQVEEALNHDQEGDTIRTGMRHALVGKPKATSNASSTEVQSTEIVPNSSRRSESPSHSTGRLIEHGSQQNYTELPVWYTWPRSKNIDSQTSTQLVEGTSSERLHTSDVLGCATLFGNFPPDTSTSLPELHPREVTITKLWERYLANVHPLTKLLFDWDTEHLVRKAATDPKKLSPSEHALMFSIYFIATLSLSKPDLEHIYGPDRAQALHQSQLNAEVALFKSGLISTNQFLVLQAFVIYLVAMRTRATPNILSSLMGIAMRIAERLGLHRDGSLLRMSIVSAEKRRRLWWHMQYMDIALAQLVGSIPLSVLADWDTRFPANLDDCDIHDDLKDLPHNRHGLTSMSHCLWRYLILYWQRERRDNNGSRESSTWLSSPGVSCAEKLAMIKDLEHAFGQQYLQYCEPLKPLHLCIQIGIRMCLLVSRRLAHYPRLADVKIQTMEQHDRDKLLQSCKEELEYCMMSETSPLIGHFRWYNGDFFPWIPLIYTILEAHGQASHASSIPLWTLIDKICSTFHTLVETAGRPEIFSVQRLILYAWCQREEYLMLSSSQSPSFVEVERPWCVTELHKQFDIILNNEVASKQTENSLPTAHWLFDMNSAPNLVFENIDWSFWEMQGGIDVF